MKAIWAWWQERDAREQRWIQAALLVLAIVVIFALFVEPAYQGRQSLLVSLPALRGQVAAMESQGSEARRLAAQGVIALPTGEALREALADSLHEHGLDSKSLVASGGAVRIELHDVAFANWVAWLDEVHAQLHVKVSEAHVKALKPGQVELTATLSPP